VQLTPLSTHWAPRKKNKKKGTIFFGHGVFYLYISSLYLAIPGNKAFFVNRALFKSKLLSRKSKLKLYQSVIRPVAVYGCQTWALK
jgi:hypothetical protein